MDDHKLSEVICLKCLKRWIAVRPTATKLIELECPNCGLPGAVIETGQELDISQTEYETVQLLC